MKKIAFVHTGYGGGLAPQLEAVMTEALGECRFYHIGESRVFPDIMERGRLTPDIEARVMPMFEQTQNTSADIVICSCSSIGEITEQAARRYTKVPIIRIDLPAAQFAVQHFDAIGLMASVETTLTPSVRLVKRLAAEAGRSIHVESEVADGALALLFQGKKEEYEARIFETAKSLASRCDVILLAQASLGPMRTRLEAATGKRFLSTPELCAAYLKDWYEGRS